MTTMDNDDVRRRGQAARGLHLQRPSARAGWAWTPTTAPATRSSPGRRPRHRQGRRRLRPRASGCRCTSRATCWPATGRRPCYVDERCDEAQQAGAAVGLHRPARRRGRRPGRADRRGGRGRAGADHLRRRRRQRHPDVRRRRQRRAGARSPVPPGRPTTLHDTVFSTIPGSPAYPGQAESFRRDGQPARAGRCRGAGAERHPGRFRFSA